MTPPLPIAEIRPPVDESVCLQRGPDGVVQTWTGFYDDRGVCGPGDTEGEAVVLDAETVTLAEDQWVWEHPWRGWATGVVRSPADGAGEVIESDVVGAERSSPVQLEDGGVTLKVDPCQTGAA